MHELPSQGTRRTARTAGALPALLLGALAAAALATLLVRACRPGPAAAGGQDVAAAAGDPAAFGELPDFRLTTQHGREVTRADLLGRPLVLSAIFSTCTGPCPAISANVHALQEELADVDVRFVSVSVDPERDTPEVLLRYAERFGADPERWLFLTGGWEEVRDFVQGGMFLSAVPDPEAPLGQQVTHDTRLLVVDRHGLRRGWYDGRNEAGRAAAAARLRHLAAEE